MDGLPPGTWLGKEGPMPWSLILFGPAYFGVSGIGGGHIAPLNIFRLGGVRDPISFENDLPRNDLPYTKGFLKF